MTPAVFEGCFGWLHRGHGRRGIVLCSAFGHEEMRAYRGWRLLAEQLAARGFHVLRFDYPGTGDSSGTETDPDRLAAWRGGISAAIDCLRSATPAETVLLVGLRLGAALAMMVAEDSPHVDAIACLAPVVVGRSYLRELRLLANARHEASFLRPRPARDDRLEVVGDVLMADTLRDLGDIDLRRTRMASRRVLLMDDGPRPQVAELGDLLARQGCEVTVAPFPGMAAYLQEGIAAQVPQTAFDELADWCDRLEPVATSGPEPAGESAWEPVLDTLQLPGAHERPLRFGEADGLFGILCAPDAGHTTLGPPVLMLNTAFGRRIGDGRVFVALARRLAALGVTSLRMDLSGFGDSLPVEGASLDPYSDRGRRDVAAALDALQRAGHDNPLVIGICSGAYTAFHAALADARVQGLILVNLQKFVWTQGSAFGVEYRRQRRPLGFYLRAARQRGAWRRFFTNSAAAAAILTTLLQRPLLRAYRNLSLALEAATGIETSSGQARRWLNLLSARDTRVDLWYSESDPGWAELTQHFTLKDLQLRGLPRIRVAVIPDADHSLHDHAARRHFMEQVCSLLEDSRTGTAHGASASLLSVEVSAPQHDRVPDSAMQLHVAGLIDEAGAIERTPVQL